jgi:hypothetical protein
MATAGALRSEQTTPAPKAFDGQSAVTMVEDFCASCHNDIDEAGSLSFDDLKAGDIAQGARAEIWEAVLRKVVQDEMPPHTKRQPSPEMRAAFVRWLASGRDAFAAAHPDPGRATLRRLNRVEYAGAVRDLLALDVDVARELPQDNSGYGFDNIADVLPLDEHVGLANCVAFRVQFLTVHHQTSVGVHLPEMFIGDTEHPPRTRSGVVQSPHNARFAENIIICVKQQTHHQADHFPWCEMFASGFVAEFRKFPDEFFKDQTHVRIADHIRMEVYGGELLDNLEQEIVGVQLCDRNSKIIFFKHVPDVFTERIYVADDVCSDIAAVGLEPLEVQW